MTARPINSIDILKFVDGEYRTAAREVLGLHSLEISERADKFRCIPEVTHISDLVFSYKQNPSKFRVGDYVLLNPYRPDLAGEDIHGGDRCVIDEMDEKNQRLGLSVPYYFRTSKPDLEPGQKYTIDSQLVSRFPIYVYPAWASGYLSTKKMPGPLIQDILKGKYRDKVIKGPRPDPPDFLLKSQKKAFRHVMKHRLSLIQGPPGTGKTFLIAQIAEAMVQMGLTVFICSFSHKSINNALNACVKNTSLRKVWKIGGEHSNDGLDDRIGESDDYDVVGMTAFASFKSRAQSIRQNLKNCNVTRPEPERLRDERFWQKIDAYTRVVFEAGIDNFEPEYDVVVFDEASQMLIHHTLMAMPAAGRYVFVGDHQQMPPVIQGYHRENPVNQSVFSLLLDYYPELNNLLDETRRMNQAITAFPSAEYYKNRLKPILEVKERKLAIQNMPKKDVLKEIIDPDAPVVFVHVDHEGYTQESPAEANLIAMIVFELVNRCGIDPKDGLCVIAAHRRQNNLIRQSIAQMVNKKKVKKATMAKILSPDLVIDTVERIQGQERDAVIVSLTASDDEFIKSEKDFLMMPNRMNVSFTRPRSKLIVVGSKKLFRTIPADRDEQYEEVIDGRPVMRSKGVMLTNYFKRWYFHVKSSQRIVDATKLAGRLPA